LFLRWAYLSANENSLRYSFLVTITHLLKEDTCHFQKQTDLRTFTSTDFLICGMHFPQLTCNKAMNQSRSSLPTNSGTHLFRTLTAATQVHTTSAVLAASVHYCLSPLLFEPFPILHCNIIVICLKYMFVLVTVSLLCFNLICPGCHPSL